MKYILLNIFFLSCSVNGPQFITEETRLDNVNIQPAEALELAHKHIGEHGTVVWKEQAQLRTHIVIKGKYYYIKQSDFPAKTANWYLTTCVRIDSKTGEVTFIE